jgi:23S rRNA (adenine2503-C2)-methyltransferase
MNLKKIEQLLTDNTQPKFRLEQIKKAIYQDGVFSWSEITNLPLDLRKKLESEIKILSFKSEKVSASTDGNSAEVLLELDDGSFVESVLISPKPNSWSVCVSCQIGCPIGCKFCATGKIGFKRNLTAEEITDQVLFWRQYLKSRTTNHEPRTKNNVSNIVFMGMGEPFLNWQNVSESIKILTDKKLFGFGSRSLSVSTAGIAEGIEKMAREFPQVNLAVSLHFVDDNKRSQFMPINKKDNLESLRKALQKYFQITKRKVFLEYIMLESINDSREDAKKLADYIKSIGNSHLLHVNLIRFNLTPETSKDNMLPSSRNKTYLFKKELEKYHISATIRKSLGEEIRGACGQLAAKQLD